MCEITATEKNGNRKKMGGRKTGNQDVRQRKMTA